MTSALKESEQIVSEDKCLYIIGESYRYSFSVEAYKRADRMLYIENGRVHIDSLCRMGVETSLKNSYLWGLCMREATIDNAYSYSYVLNMYKRILEIIYHRMHSKELSLKYPNPADRFVFILKQEAMVLKK